MILTHDQIIELTGKVRAKAQCRQLDFMGIPYRKRINGTPVVLASDLSPTEKTERVGPRFDLL